MSTRRKPTRGNPAAPKAPRVTITPDGQVYIVADHRHSVPMPEADGAHHWVALTVHVVDPTRPVNNLDERSLATIEGPMCWHCETGYDPATASQPCPGRGYASTGEAAS